jgi:hypothetical protein
MSVQFKNYRRLIELAESRNAKLPTFIAVVLANRKLMVHDPPEDICSALGMSEHYAHLVRSLLKVEGELNGIGYYVVPR